MVAGSIPVIVTRAQPGNTETTDRLNRLGCDPIPAPVLALVPLPETEIPETVDLSGLIFTSANGVRSYTARRSDRSLPVWCVGPATADAARTAGFRTVHESSGNSDDLARFIATTIQPDTLPLLHVANQDAAGALAQELRRLGHKVLFAGIYAMRTAKQLPARVLRLNRDDPAVILLVHSAKGAQAFRELMQDDAPAGWSLVAISKRAAAPLESLVRGPVFIADTPNEDGIMRALGDAIATLSA